MVVQCYYNPINPEVGYDLDMLEIPANLAELRRAYKRAISDLDSIKAIAELRKYADWGEFAWPVLSQLCNNVDMPFVKLMVSLSKHGYRYSAISMMRWWRRLKAIGQEHIISYFSYTNFVPPQFIMPDQLTAHCDYGQSMFGTITKMFSDNKLVEMSLRSMLGISQASDIKTAWIAWAKEHHPDRGGDTDTFIKTKAAYEEWADCNKETQK